MKTEGLLKVTDIYVVNMVISRKRCKIETSLLQTTNKKQYMALSDLQGHSVTFTYCKPF